MRDHGNNLATGKSGDGKIWRRENLATGKSGDHDGWHWLCQCAANRRLASFWSAGDVPRITNTHLATAPACVREGLDHTPRRIAVRCASIHPYSTETSFVRVPRAREISHGHARCGLGYVAEAAKASDELSIHARDFRALRGLGYVAEAAEASDELSIQARDFRTLGRARLRTQGHRRPRGRHSLAVTGWWRRGKPA
jgi:hypothetical protein